MTFIITLPFLFLWKMPVEFWLGLSWICRSLWVYGQDFYFNGINSSNPWKWDNFSNFFLFQRHQHCPLRLGQMLATFGSFLELPVIFSQGDPVWRDFPAVVCCLEPAVRLFHNKFLQTRSFPAEKKKRDNYILIHQNACLKNAETKKQIFWSILTLMSS